MHTLADRHYVYDLQGAEIRFGGDVFLQPRSERFAELIACQRKEQCERNEHETPQRRFGPFKREPGKGPGKKRSGRHVGSATRVDGESAFAGVESRVSFRCRFPDLLCGQIAEQKKSGGVGMSRHAFTGMLVRKQMNGGMLKCMIAPRFENEGKVEDHELIIYRTRLKVALF